MSTEDSSADAHLGEDSMSDRDDATNEELRQLLQASHDEIRARDDEIRARDDEIRRLRAHVHQPAESTSSGITSTSSTPRKGIISETTDGCRVDLGLAYKGSKDGPSSKELVESAINEIIKEHTEHERRKATDDTYDVDEHKKNIAAPFLFLLQSTGYGKTRSMLEFAQKEKNRKKVVYLLCSKDRENWKVPVAMNHILSIESNDENLLECKWEKFLGCIIETVNEINSLGKDLYKSQITDDYKLGSFYDLLERKISERGDPKKSAMRRSSKDETTKTVNFRDYPSSKAINEESLVICFDEASAFDTTKINSLRRMGKMLGLICVFSDSFMPENDPSSSTSNGNLGHFRRPIFAFRPPNWERGIESDESPLLYVDLFCAGRPRWKSYLSKTLDGEDKKIEKLVKLAQYLLLRTTQHDFDQDAQYALPCEVDNMKAVCPAMIALFACRFSLGHTSKLSETLVRYNLATVVGVSEERDTISSTYPSEPLLASASALLTADTQRLTKVLQHVKAAMHHKNKILDPPRGDTGEMCAAAILGYGMDYVRSSQQGKKDDYMCEPVGLREFLALFNPTVANEAPSLDDWTVNFTHVVRMFGGEPTETDLELMWKQRMAYYVPEGYTGLDILIAIYNATTKSYGTLRVQVKNCKKKIAPGEASIFVHKLHPRWCTPKMDVSTPSVSFLLCVNDVDSRCHDTGNAQQTKRDRDSKPKDGGNVLLELTASFPSTDISPLKDVAIALRKICETSVDKKCDVDYFFWEPNQERKMDIEEEEAMSAHSQ